MDKKSTSTPHRPISVTGGDYNAFYLSGYLQPKAPAYTASTINGGRNAECYISGGRFGEVAGAGYEQIDGYIKWQIYDADMESFYGGGINENQPVTDSIVTYIRGSHVGTFCGGPKFGNMTAEKKVQTMAVDCVFGIYFGAGFGGTGFTRVNTYNHYKTLNYDWNGMTEDEYIVPKFTRVDGAHKRGKYVSGQGISINYDYRNFEGSNDKTVAYLFVNYASMSVAQTNNVFSTLTGCTIEQNFYGGGSRGKVAGNVTSTLDDCTVLGNVFGAGYSASVPTANVFPGEDAGLFSTKPSYNDKTGVFEKGVFPTAVEYTWSKTKGDNTTTLVDDSEGHWIHTDSDLTSLGTVTNDVSLTLKGNTTVQGSVFGAGDSSKVEGNTEVKVIEQAKVCGNIYGGGNKGIVGGNTKVIVNGQ